MILMDDQMQMRNLFVDKFCLGPFAVWKVNKANKTISKTLTDWEKSTNQTIENN